MKIRKIYPFIKKRITKKLDMTKNSFHLWVADFCTCSRHLYNHLRIPSKVKFEHNRQRQSCLNLTIVTIEHNCQRQSCLNLTWRSPSCWRASPSRPPWLPRLSTSWLLLQNPFLLSWSQMTPLCKKIVLSWLPTSSLSRVARSAGVLEGPG